MTAITNDVLLKELEAAKKIFKILDFSSFETEQHLEKISNILTAKIIATLLENRGFQSDQETSTEAIACFIKEKYSQDEVGAVVKNESTVFLRNYFEAILKGANEAKIDEIKTILG